MQTVRDPTLYQWYFFIRWHSRDSDAQRQEHAQGFRAVLQEAWGWAGDESEAPQVPTAASLPVQVSERLASVSWRKRGDTLRELEARTLLDAFYLQLGQALEGDAPPAAWQGLAPWRPAALAGGAAGHAYLGEVVCLGGQVDDATPEEALADLAVVAAGRPGARPTLEGVPLLDGLFAVVPGAERETLVLLYRASAARRVQRFVHSLLPQLLLNRLKVRRIADSYDGSVRRRQEKEEETLDALLKQAARPGLRLEDLERLSIAISRQQTSLLEKISTLAEHLQTLHVSARNVESLLDDPAWHGQRELARPLLTGPLPLLVEQMESDLQYLRITEQRADRALANLTTIAGVRGTQWERRITLLLGVFAVLGLAQVFPESPHEALPAWLWRLALIGLGGTAAALGYAWLRSRS